MLYVIQEKVGKAIKGTVDVAVGALPEWEKKFIMTPKDESFRGKSHYEIKKQGNNIRLATQQEIDDYKQTQKQSQETTKKQNIRVAKNS